MQQSFVTQATEVNLLDIDLTGKTQAQLADLAHQALDESVSLARRSVANAWFAGKILERVKQQLKHGQWSVWVNQQGFSLQIANRVRRLYRYDRQNVQIEQFGSVDEALKALAPKREPKQIEQPEPQPEPTRTEATEQPKQAVDITTGEMTDFPTDRQPTAAEQIQAQDSAPKAVQDVKLTKADVLKNQPTETEPRKPQVKTMQRNMRFSKEQNGTEVLEHLYQTDYVVISARDLWRLIKGFPLQGLNGEQVVFQKGEVLR